MLLALFYWFDVMPAGKEVSAFDVIIGENPGIAGAFIKIFIISYSV